MRQCRNTLEWCVLLTLAGSQRHWIQLNRYIYIYIYIYLWVCSLTLSLWPHPHALFGTESIEACIYTPTVKVEFWIVLKMEHLPVCKNCMIKRFNREKCWMCHHWSGCVLFLLCTVNSSWFKLLGSCMGFSTAVLMALLTYDVVGQSADLWPPRKGGGRVVSLYPNFVLMYY